MGAGCKKEWSAKLFTVWSTHCRRLERRWMSSSGWCESQSAGLGVLLGHTRQGSWGALCLAPVAHLSSAKQSLLPAHSPLPPRPEQACPHPPPNPCPCRQSLSAMPREQRQVVHQLAEQYGLVRLGRGVGLRTGA